jgi:hypothetical protein
MQFDVFCVLCITKPHMVQYPVGSHTVNVYDLTSKCESSETKNAFKKYDLSIQPTAEALAKMGVDESGLYDCTTVQVQHERHV